MIRVKFIKKFKKNIIGDVVETTIDIAMSLVNKGVAIFLENSNFISKTKFGKTKAIGKKPNE